MEAEILKYLSTGSDLLVYFVAYGFWKFDRRLLKIETEESSIHKLVEIIKDHCTKTKPKEA